MSAFIRRNISLAQLQGRLNYFYHANRSLLEPSVSSKFIESHCDLATKNFLSRCLDECVDPSFPQTFCSKFMSKTNTNGIFGTGDCFLASKQQFRNILPTETFHSVIDLGAGSGNVTSELISAIDLKKIATTEISPAMRRTLKNRGLNPVDHDKWPEKGPYDLISMFNLLDRLPDPIEYINAAFSSLNENGVLVIGLVFPVNQVVELQTRGSSQPNVILPIKQHDYFESQVEQFLNIFDNEKLDLHSWTKLPYLSIGNSNKPCNILENGLFVFKKV